MAAPTSVLSASAQIVASVPLANMSSTGLPSVMTNTASPRLLIGVVLAISANLVISIGLNVQKFVHNRNEAKPESERQPFTQSPLWWVGLSGTVFGEVGNFLAFGFAGADIVTPLGAVAVVSNAVIACTFLGERFRIRDALGVLLTCLGSVLVVMKAPSSEENLSVSELMHYVTNPIFISYIVVVLLLMGLLWWFLPRLRHRHPAYGLMLCSLMGTLTVLCSTALSNFINRLLTDADSAQFISPVPYVLILILVPCAIGQVRYLNETMEQFDNTQVVPVYYFLFTLSTITGSAMLYQDFYEVPGDAIAVFVFGCILCFTGVGLLTSGRGRGAVDADGEGVGSADDAPVPPDGAGDHGARPAAVRPAVVSVTAHSPPPLRAPRRTGSLLQEALRKLDSPMPLPMRFRKRAQKFARFDGAQEPGEGEEREKGAPEEEGEEEVPDKPVRRNLSAPSMPASEVVARARGAPPRPHHPYPHPAAANLPAVHHAPFMPNAMLSSLTPRGSDLGRGTREQLAGVVVDLAQPVPAQPGSAESGAGCRRTQSAELICMPPGGAAGAAPSCSAPAANGCSSTRQALQDPHVA